MPASLSRLAAPYTALLPADALRCAEPSGDGLTEAWLQTFWKTHAPRLPLHLPDGTPVTVHHPGEWNHAPGPDFHDADLSLGDTRFCGDVELHLHPEDWQRHRHARNPDFQNLILHVTWFEGPRPPTLPASVPTLALRPFAGEAAARSPASAAAPPPLHHPCFHAPQQRTALLELLHAAGYHRFYLKTKAFASALAPEPDFQVFYEALLRAMGYRRNTGPFQQLAVDTPFEAVKPLPSLQRFAVLAGNAGLLPESARDLWDLRWQSGLPPPLTAYTWDLRALRPQNHPLRRLAGAVGILHHIRRLLDLPLEALPGALAEAGDFLREPLHAPHALIGKARAVTLLINLFVPYRLALGTLPAERLERLPGEPVSAPMEETWTRLTGTADGIPRSGLLRQGLLQLYSDFCHNPAVRCAGCPIAATR